MAKSHPATSPSGLKKFQQDLFSMMNNLQAAISNAAANETATLNKLIEAEEKMTAAAVDFGGPSPNFTAPSWAGASPPNERKSFAKIFQPIIKQVLSQRTASEAEHTIDWETKKIDLLFVFENAFNALGDPKIGKGDLELLLIWVENAIIESSMFLSVAEQEGILNQMANDLLKPSSNIPRPTGTSFDGDGDSSYRNWVIKEFEKYKQLFKAHDADAEELTKQLLDLLESTRSEYPLNSKKSIRTWIHTSIRTAPSTIQITSLQKEELIDALEQEINPIFPQADAAFFYDHLQKRLFQNIINPPTSTPSSSPLLAPEKSSFLDSAIPNPDVDGIKSVIDRILLIKEDSTEEYQSIAKNLESTFKELIQKGIRETFNQLPAYGAQGQLMSSTYDYQLMSRISDYSTALVEELKLDYNHFIPANSSNALTAAQEITSASVSFIAFASSLSAVSTAFKKEVNYTKALGPAATIAAEVKKLIENDTYSPYRTLQDLANATYLSDRPDHEPVIKAAEQEAVSLASFSAGFKASFDRFLSGAETVGLTALANRKERGETNFEAAYKNYDAKAKKYFAARNDYVAAKQTFKYDALKLKALQNTLTNFSTAMEKGITPEE